MGGMLASIKSKEANDFIIRLSSGKCLWLGGSDQIEEGVWLWRDGSPVSFTYWAPREPDDWKGREDWLVIGWPGDRFKNGRWGDTKPFARSPIVGFICEWN